MCVRLQSIQHKEKKKTSFDDESLCALPIAFLGNSYIAYHRVSLYTHTHTQSIINNNAFFKIKISIEIACFPDFWPRKETCHPTRSRCWMGSSRFLIFLFPPPTEVCTCSFFFQHKTRRLCLSGLKYRYKIRFIV